MEEILQKQFVHCGLCQLAGGIFRIHQYCCC